MAAAEQALEEKRQEVNRLKQLQELPAIGLVVKDPFATMIVKGEKTWEVRTKRTMMRTRIGIVKSGSKTVIGEVSILDCIELTDQMLDNGFAHHKIQDIDQVFNHTGNRDIQYYAWVLEKAQQYHRPMPYQHPPGAITWVRLKPIDMKRSSSLTTSPALSITPVSQLCLEQSF